MLRKSLILISCVYAAEALVAAPIVILGPANVAITTFSYTVVGTTITLNETWTLAGPGVLKIDGLDNNVDYTVVKNVTNMTGVDWYRFTNELMNPAGTGFDALDVVPQPSFVPSGYSTSNDFDGLSFAQSSGIPRTSDIFTTVLDDEFTNRDFLDFFGGGMVAGNGGVVQLSYGLRHSNDIESQQPFLLYQRSNVSSFDPDTGTEVPEPTTISLLGLGLLFVGYTRSRSKSRAI